MEIENKLKAMGLELPAAGTPPAGRAGAVRIGNILFVGGHTARQEFRGKLGAEITVEQGYEAAKLACLACLADVKAAIHPEWANLRVPHLSVWMAAGSGERPNHRTYPAMMK